MAGTEVIFFNRLEKVGSQSMSSLLFELGKHNNFANYENTPMATKPEVLSAQEELEFAEEFIETLQAPAAYVEHANWINFTQFGLPKPIYINLIRHPIDKVISAYYYQRHPFVYYNSLQRNPFRREEKKDYFDISFNDCVKLKKFNDCDFSAENKFSRDWRKFAKHFCGNRNECR